MKDKNWAPDRIWLQRDIGDNGSHTWCDSSIGDDIEEVEYVLADSPTPGADARPVAASKQHVLNELSLAAARVATEDDRTFNAIVSAKRMLASQATISYKAAADCPYLDVCDNVKTAWADGWNQCAQVTKGGRDGN